MRSFTLPGNVDEANIKAEFKDGMLNLSLPKTAETKPKATEVKIQQGMSFSQLMRTLILK
jgi:HSP20 family protein